MREIYFELELAESKDKRTWLVYIPDLWLEIDGKRPKNRPEIKTQKSQNMAKVAFKTDQNPEQNRARHWGLSIHL